jgi:transglutaminase-like putative cysteine protease
MPDPSSTPRPGRRLWRTWLKWPRKLQALAPPVSFEPASIQMPDPAEAAHWGEYILLEDNVNVLHRDGTSSRYCHYVTVLHAAHVLAAWDQRQWYYDRRTWRPTVRRAAIHLPEGKTLKMRPSDRATDASGALRLVQVQFSPLRPGVALEWQEQIDIFQPSPGAPHIAGAFFHRTASPCRHRRYTVAVARPFSLELRSHHGAARPEESEVDGYRVYRWELHNVPGIEWDAWTPHLRDFVPWTDYSTLTSWKPVAAHLRLELMPRGAVSLGEQAKSLTCNAATPHERALALYEYAARQVRYGRPVHETFDRLSRPIARVAEDLRGDCKDKSALLVGLLREAGVPASIAVLSTRSQGEAPYLPAGRFDHAIVTATIDDRRLWLDPAAGAYTFGEVPYGDQGVHALILDEEGPHYDLVPRAEPQQHGAHHVFKARLDEAGDYHFEARVEFRGDRAAQWRLALRDRSEDYRARQVRQAVGHRLPGVEVGAVRFTGIEDLGSNPGYEFSGTLRHRARRIERLLLLRIAWAEPVAYEGPLAAPERRAPLCAPLVQGLSEEHEIEVPPGFSGYGLPLESRESCPWGSYHCSIRFEEGKLHCTRRLEMHGGVTPVDRFAEVKRFYEICARCDEADVVLVQEHL